MVYFKENFNFPRFQECPTFSRAGVQLFQGGGGPIANFYGNL